MNFKCSNCNYKHNIQKDSYFLNPETGSLVYNGWYKDNRGKNFWATVCLQCGTIHATTDAAHLHVLFGNPFRVEKFITYEQLQEVVFEMAHKNTSAPIHAFNAFDFPEIVINALRRRGYLSFLDIIELTAFNEKIAN